MTNVMGDYAVLYWCEYLAAPVRPVLTHTTPFMIKNDIPMKAEEEAEVEVESSVCRLRLKKEDGHTHPRENNFKKWMREAYQVEGK